MDDFILREELEDYKEVVESFLEDLIFLVEDDTSHDRLKIQNVKDLIDEARMDLIQ